MSNLLTVSRLRSYRKCARLESYQYVEGFRPAIVPEALLFGTLWHDGMDAMWAAWADGDGDDALNAACQAVAGKASDAFIEAKCVAMLQGYYNRWDAPGFQIIGIEDEFRAPLINPSTMLPSRTWELAGKIDKRITTSDGRNLIVDHKTTSLDLAPESSYWLQLQMDHQISIYMIGAEALGWPPVGAMWDVVRKPMLQPLKATPVENRKYTKDGKLYAVQRELDETPAEYGARCGETIAADPEKYFQRKEIPRTESQLAEFLDDAWSQSKVMHESHLAQRAPRNPESCFAFGGQCAFWTMCSTGANPAESSDFRRIESKHPELTKAA